MKAWKIMPSQEAVTPCWGINFLFLRQNLELNVQIFSYINELFMRK